MRFPIPHPIPVPSPNPSPTWHQKKYELGGSYRIGRVHDIRPSQAESTAANYNGGVEILGISAPQRHIVPYQYWLARRRMTRWTMEAYYEQTQ